MDREGNSNFMDHYRTWRPTRLRKIEKLFSPETFENKTILEVGCGYGDIGKYFIEKYNSIVTFTEGREEHIPYIKENNPNSIVILQDHDTNWNLNKKYDVLLHFGLLYHLNNWENDLICSMNHSDLILLESEIADSNDVAGHFVVSEGGGYDQSINNDFGVRPSASNVERVINENGFEFIRYDDSDLNDDYHVYDWKVTGAADNTGKCIMQGIATRRFWVIRRKK